MADGQCFVAEGAMKPGAAEIVVAIPTLNEASHIETCIESLLVGDERLKDIQFVVADGGSTDGTRAIVDRLAIRFPNVCWIDNPGRLQSAAVNRVAEIHGDGRTILVRCDAHSIYPPGYVTRVADALKSRGVASLVVPMDAVGRTCFQKANAWIVDTPLGSGGSAHRGGTQSGFVDHGHHAGFDMAMFRTVGGYDETFSHNEDAEYDARIAAAGGKIFLDADIRIEYLPRDGIMSLARQYVNYGKGRARTIRKHNLTPRLRQLFPALNLVVFVGAACVAPLWWPALLYPLAYLGGLVFASAWMVYRHRSLCGVWAGVAAGTMHMSWAYGFLKARFVEGR
ncbi:MAG: glycosyltransferase family 2 protein [Pseudomonadota bacterium]